MRKSLIFLTFTLTSLFSAKIGVVGNDDADPHITEFLKRHLEPDGHIVQELWKDRRYRKYDVILCSNRKPYLTRYKHKVIVTCYEPEVIIREHAHYNTLRKYLGVLTWNHNLAGQYGFIKFHYPTDLVVHDENNIDLLPFEDKKLACIVNSFININHPKQLYTKRKEVALFYNHNYPNDFSLYGRRGWDESLKPVYKGISQSKDDVYRNHKFTYCFENWDNDVHYVSEKIFDAINSLCVPIYLGSKNITDFVPEECFIDARKFSSIQEIHDFISAMDEETYMGYINAMVKYSQSEDRKKFTHDYYKYQVLDYIRSKIE